MAGADGKIHIDTEIDKSGVKYDAKDIEREMENMGKRISKTSERYNNQMTKNYEYYGRSVRRVYRGQSEEARRMHSEMRSAYMEQRQSLYKYKDELIGSKYAFFQLGKAAKDYTGTSRQFMGQVEAQGRVHKKVMDEMIKNNEMMKVQLIQSVGQMIVRTTQATRIMENFDRMKNPLYQVNKGALAVASGLNQIAMRGQPAALALKMLGPTANMKQLKDMTMMISQGIMRMTMVALVASVTAVKFYSTLHKGAMESNKAYAKAFAGMKKSVRQAFEPLFQVFAAVMIPVFNFIKKIADLTTEFNKAHPKIAKFVAAIILLVPALMLILAPLAAGIGLFAGFQAALGAAWMLIGPLITGLAAMSGTVWVVAAAIVQLMKPLGNLKEWFKSNQDLIKPLLAQIKNFVTILSSGIWATIKVMISGVVDAFALFFETINFNVDSIADLTNFLIEVNKNMASFFSFISSNEDVLKSLGVGVLSAVVALKAFKIITTAITMITGFTKTLSLMVFAFNNVKKTSGIARAAIIAFNLAFAANPIGLIITLIAGLVGALVWFFTQTKTGQKIIQTAWEGIKNVTQVLADWLVTTWTTVSTFFVELWGNIKNGAMTLWNGVVEIWNAVVTGVKTAWTGVSTFFITLWTSITTFASEAWNIFSTTIMGIIQPFIDIFMAAWTGISEGLKLVWEGIKNIAMGAWELIKNVILGPILLLINLITGDMEGFKENLKSIWNNIKAAASQIWGGIKQVVSGLVLAVVSYAKGVWDGFKLYIKTLWEGIKNIASSVWNWIKTTIINLVKGIIDGAKRNWEAMKNATKAAWDWIKNTASAVWNGIKTTVVNLVKGIKDGAVRKWNELKDKTKEIFEKVVGFIKNPLKGIDLSEIGKNIIQGLIGGIGSMAEKVKEKVGEVVDGIKDKITGALKIKSPSRWMRDNVGKFIPQGIAVGIEADSGIAMKAADGLTASLMPDMRGMQMPDMSKIRMPNLATAFSGMTPATAAAAPVPTQVEQPLSITFTGNIIVRNDDDIKRVAEELGSQVNRARRGLE